MARGKGFAGMHEMPPTSRIAGKMKETVDGVKGFERYQREFGLRGIILWEAFQGVNQWLIAGISTRGDLADMQKSVAVKEFQRRAWGERGVEKYLIGLMTDCILYAKELIPIPIPKPRA